MVGWKNPDLPESGRDGLDFEAGELAAVAFGFVEAFAALVFEGDDLLGADLADHLGGHAGSGHRRGSDAQAAAGLHAEDLVEGGGFAGFDGEEFDVHLVAFADTVLFAAGFENRVCHKPECA